MSTLGFKAPQYTRMILLLEWLRDARKFNTKDVVEHFQGEYSVRTIKNDIENLRVLGYAIEYSYDKKSYILTDDSGDFPVFQLRQSELEVLKLAQQLFENIGARPLAETADDVVNRVHDILPLLSGRDYSNLSPSLTVLQGPHAEVSFPHWEDLQRAIEEERTVKMDYFTMSRNVLTKRLADPYKLVAKEGRSYMIAWCHEREKVSIFRLDRIQTLELTDNFFDVEPDFDEQSFLAPMFGMFNDGKAFKVKVHFSPWVARWIREDRWHPSQTFTDLPDGSLQVDLKVTGTIDVKRWILSFGREAEVIEPEHLRAAVALDIRELSQTYA